MPPWTAADIPNLAGRTVIVTGATGGIGWHTALELARRGARTVVAGRDPDKAEAAAASIRARTGPRTTVQAAPLDLADLASVRRFTARFLADHDGLDVLVNNAGVMAIPRELTADGFERQLGTNHLGHFALTGLLLSALLARPGARVVTVSSSLYASGRVDFDDLMGERNYGQLRAYNQSKLANVLFAFELQRRADAVGAALASVVVHPGVARTNLAHTGGPVRAVLLRLMRLTAQTPAEAARSSLFAATTPDIHGGEFIAPGGPGQRSGHPTRIVPDERARDTATASRLWTVSQELTGVRFTAFDRA
ncbi:SDR family NAD(P)-dependent oxidoreductase [Dactylosporangium roseum]|uniref:SDR family NAD(P)-dependent oxidoreductase n=1 Tax=Dactylosporangium roseum TaxID=47989 RepID=A0ABY5Z4G1_9ACTN|nr:oxidoreductase [Dactylosporangium roseum]UWZ36352.1 SDR family NAD(P)-dependent oxidoreductase [Dactylosporangium roseum]